MLLLFKLIAAAAAVPQVVGNYMIVERIKAGFTRPGVTICGVVRNTSPIGTPIEAFEHIAVNASGKIRPLRGLNDLAGEVTIKSQADALDYVRLRTDPSTWFMWHGTPRLEVIDRSHAKRMHYHGKSNYLSVRMSGFGGVLTDAAFRQARFDQATVRDRPGGYVVRRWLLVESVKRNHTELVEELVGHAGSYSVRLLKHREEKSNLYIPKFE